MVVANIISYVLVIIGALNWGLFGIFDFNLVGWIFQGPRTAGSIIVYVLITLAAVWRIISDISWGVRISPLRAMSFRTKLTTSPTEFSR